MSNYKLLKCLGDVNSISSLNWSQFALESLADCAREWKEVDRTSLSTGQCLHCWKDLELKKAGEFGTGEVKPRLILNVGGQHVRYQQEIPTETTEHAKKMIVSLGAGPRDTLFGGGNIPAFVMASVAAFAAGVITTLKMPNISGSFKSAGIHVGLRVGIDCCYWPWPFLLSPLYIYGDCPVACIEKVAQTAKELAKSFSEFVDAMDEAKMKFPDQ
ncbi:Sucrose transport protein SUC3 [Bienertia sinuspersici]